MRNFYLSLPYFASHRGFTLVELMVVMAVIAVLATMALFGLGKAQAGARDSNRQQIVNGVRTSMERYYGDKGYYPTAADAWGTPVGLLVTGGYLALAPTDPCKGGTAIPTTGIMGAGNCTPTAYSYVPTPASCAAGACTGYQITLTKESGGQSVFNSPQ